MRRSFTERDPVPIAIVGLIGIAVLIALSLSWQRLPFVDSGTTYHAVFADAAGLVPGEGLNSSTTQRQQLLRPFPQYQDIQTWRYDGSSRYHALQSRVERRFAQGYTVSDVQCAANGAPPCTLAPNPKAGGMPGYDHKMVFSFSAPRDQDGRLVQQGQLITGFAGGISEFNGLTEVGFPQTFADEGAEVNNARIPAPAVFDMSWFTNKYMFERNEAGLIEIDGAKVCDLDQDYDTYKQWKLDPSGAGSCAGNKNLINVITTGIVPSETITSLVGKTLPKVVGVLRPVNIGSFNVWIIYPRDSADLTQ